MLRSLVGSEMCIRDRATPGRRYVLLGQNSLFGGVAIINPDNTYQVVSGCLLYTSDAADDLLCVDLGGRRIIKKKKHK